MQVCQGSPRLPETVGQALAAEGPVVVDSAVDPAAISAVPHVELSKILKFGIGRRAS